MMCGCLTATAHPPTAGETGVDDTAATALGAPVLAAALAALPDGILLFDPSRTIGYINPAGAALAGRPASDLTGRNVWIAGDG